MYKSTKVSITVSISADHESQARTATLSTEDNTEWSMLVFVSGGKGASGCWVPLARLLTCEDSRAGRFAFLAAHHGREADLVLGGGEQAGQGVVGDVAVNYQAVHSSCVGNRRVNDINRVGISLKHQIYLAR